MHGINQASIRNGFTTETCAPVAMGLLLDFDTPNGEMDFHEEFVGESFWDGANSSFSRNWRH